MTEDTTGSQDTELINMAENHETAPAAKRYGVRKESVALMLIIAMAVSACGTAATRPVAVGPVDHECHGNPARSQGSGCDDYP
jgi:hypothetical protein